jgi:hypothetical protein
MRVNRTVGRICIAGAVCASLVVFGCSSAMKVRADSGTTTETGGAAAPRGQGSGTGGSTSSDGNEADGNEADGNEADGNEADGTGAAAEAAAAPDGRVRPQSNCAADADCGPGGRCSPSQTKVLCYCPVTALCDDSSRCTAGNVQVPCACGDACGHGNFCHTPHDACSDDSDCSEGSCNYDWVEGLWSCSICWPHSIVP